MRRSAFLLAASFLVFACSSGSQTEAVAATSDRPFDTAVVADFDAPWAMTFLPEGRALITEKDGRLMLLSADAKTRQAVAGTPEVDSDGQGGLMDVVLHPEFSQNRTIYFSYSEAASGGKGVALATGRLLDMDGGPQLDGFKVIFRATPYVQGNGHYSGRIAFSPDGKYLFFTNGERQKFTPAQDPTATLGKVLRLNLDGTPAADNPLVARGFHPAVYSYGHRNLLGIAFDAQGNMWNQEMGPEGGDELNLVKPAANYGYPKASNGRNYGAATDDIPDHKPGDGFEAPKVYWTPVISPSGLIIYSSDMFPEWKGSAFIGGLSSKALIRVKLDGENATKADQWDMGARIREVEQGPDGAVWLLEDGGRGSEGRLLKLTPKK